MKLKLNAYVKHFSGNDIEKGWHDTGRRRFDGVIFFRCSIAGL